METRGTNKAYGWGL